MKYQKIKYLENQYFIDIEYLFTDASLRLITSSQIK